MKTRKLLLMVALVTAGAVTGFAQSAFLSSYANVDGNQVANSVTLDADTTYILDLKYYVLDGQQLIIEPGTKIKATFGTGLAAPALIVSRGGQIDAQGTATDPIIFTTVEDLLDGQYPIKNQGRWGGVLLLGRAYTNLQGGQVNEFGVQDGEGTIEGLDVPDDRHHYGQDRYESQDPEVQNDPNLEGTLKPGGDFDNADNSGIMQYVSIRHGGAVIGTANEINGLTLGGVGSGTTLENIEIVSNQDDGIEFFGGTANIKYATILFCNDDYIDWDQGYSGKGQFIYGLQLPSSINPQYSIEGDNGMEIDGDDDDLYNSETDSDLAAAGVLMSNPTFYNVTMIGNGSDDGIEAKERTWGTIRNSIFANYSAGVDLNQESDRDYDGFYNWEQGNLILENNTFAGNGNMLTVGGAAAEASVVSTFEGDGNLADDNIIDYTLEINAISNAISNSVNPVPAAGEASSSFTPSDSFFDAVSYRGAFEPGTAAGSEWIAGWTAQENIALQCPSDLNNDGETNTQDFLLFLPEFGVICGE